MHRLISIYAFNSDMKSENCGAGCVSDLSLGKNMPECVRFLVDVPCTGLGSFIEVTPDLNGTNSLSRKRFM